MKKAGYVILTVLLAGSLTGCGLSGQNVQGKSEAQMTETSELTGPSESGTASETTVETEKTETEANELPGADITEHETDVVRESAGRSMRKVAYFTSWSAYARGLEVGDLDGNLLTHVNFAFANLNGEGDILVGDSWVDIEKPFGDDTWENGSDVKGHFGRIQKMKELYPHLKFLISVGGWTWSGNFSDVASGGQSRKRFAASAVDFLKRYGFDGIDLDWEFPVEGGNGITHRPEDRHNYTLLLKEVRSALDAQEVKDGKHYLLTIAGGPNPSFTQNTEISEMMEYLDFMNIMAYDYHGGWESRTGHNAPLYASDGLSVSDTVNAYLGAGALPEKLNLGLAFYGRGWGNVSESGVGKSGSALSGTGYGQGTWEAGVFDYWDLREHYEGKNQYVRYYDEHAQAPYLFNGTTWISYDDSQSIREKLEFAKDKNLGGIMFWEFSGDKNKELQKVIDGFAQSDQGAKRQQAETTGTNQAETEAAKADQEGVKPTAAWSKTAVYQQGDIVSYQGHTYRAKWWSQAEEPDSHSGEWDVWERIEAANQ